MLLSTEPLARAICGFDFPLHFGEWETLADTCKRLLAIASRDMGKTTFFSKLLPISRVIQRPNYEICMMSYSETQVTKIVTGIKDLFDTKPLIKSLKKNNDEDWSKTSLKFKNGAKIDSLTFGSSGRGGHYDLVLVDDPIKDYSGMNPDDQEDYFKRAVTPMVKPDGQLIVVGNFVYENDLIERLERNRAYTTKLYPAIADGRALWPERWPLELLAEREREVGSYAFAREYLLQKISAHSGFFQRDKIRFYDTAPDRLAKVMSVDPAISATGDFTAIVVTGTSEDNKTYVLDYANIQTDDVTKIIEEVFRLQEIHDVPYCQVETIGFQRLLKHWLYDEMRKQNRYFGVEEIKTHTKSKQARIMALQPRIHSGSLMFRKDQQEIISQLMAFPRGLHDDIIDALCFQVGKWDKPEEVTSSPPQNSFEWWRNQIPEEANNWMESLNL